MLEIPSKVNDRKYIRMPNQDKVVEDDDEWSQCGKWILMNLSGGMSWIDETWIKLQVLLEKGFLIMIKASTAAMAHNPNEAGTILCFTRPGEEEIERAAKEIRKTVHYEHVIYYKINKMTQNKIDHRFGHKSIPLYMHTFNGFLYRNCPEEGWILVNDAERVNKQKNSLSVERWKINNFVDTGVQLLSRSKDIHVIMKSKNKSLGLRAQSRFIIHCSLEEREKCLSEADRLWIIGKKLIDAGVVYQIICKKDSNTAEIDFDFLNELDDESSVKLCDKIQDESQVFRFFYITTIKNQYRYSPEKELVSLPDSFKIYNAKSFRKKKHEYVIWN